VGEGFEAEQVDHGVGGQMPEGWGRHAAAYGVHRMAPPDAVWCGMAEEMSIRVNFSRPLPLFPLPQVVMLPQQITPLHIFEPRYRQMVDRALDGAGQIAMAKYAIGRN
jgi:hypothetical protein